MSVSFLTRTIEEGPAIARVAVSAKEIQLALTDADLREAVCAALPLCRVRAIKMNGAPKPPSAFAAQLALEDLEGVLKLASRGHLPTSGAAASPDILSYARKRVAFERQWRSRNGAALKDVRIFGAGSIPTSPDAADIYWTALQTAFGKAHGQTLSLKALAEIHWNAVEGVMGPDEFSTFSMSMR